jgi:ectoine hydroxylase-related dioxygenase (phytanoyl-CoA dioxygenase family)
MFRFPDKMMRVFRDEQMQEQFERDGFVVVDFYNDDELKEVNNLFESIHPKGGKGFFPSPYSTDKNYREKTDSELKRIGQRRFNELLINHKIICGSFIVKYPGEDSYLHVHQDMTLVDETKYTGINVWTPLCDLTDNNGVLYVLPGSHRFFPTYRGHTLDGFYDPVHEEIKDYMVPYYLKAGQSVIFDQSIVHFSPPNLSDKIRVVTNVYFTHQDANFVICYHDKDNPECKNKVELFEEDMSFMTNYDQFGTEIMSRPHMGRSMGLTDYDFPKLTIDMLENKFGMKKLRDYTPTKKIKPDQSVYAGNNGPQLPQSKNKRPLLDRIMAFIKN